MAVFIIRPITATESTGDKIQPCLTPHFTSPYFQSDPKISSFSWNIHRLEYRAKKQIFGQKLTIFKAISKYRSSPRNVDSLGVRAKKKNFWAKPYFQSDPKISSFCPKCWYLEDWAKKLFLGKIQFFQGDLKYWLFRR